MLNYHGIDCSTTILNAIAYTLTMYLLSLCQTRSALIEVQMRMRRKRLGLASFL